MLEKPAAKTAVLGKIIGGFKDAFVCGCENLQRIVRDERTDCARIHPPFRRSGDRPRETPGRTARKRVLDHRQKIVRFLIALRREAGIAFFQEQRGRATQPGDAPEIVPVIKVVGPKMFRAETRRQQSRLRQSGIFWEPLSRGSKRAPFVTATSHSRGNDSPVSSAKRWYIQIASPLESHSPSCERK